MATRFRDLQDADVQDFLDRVSTGKAGQNPQAQTLARSTNNPQAQAYGQAMLDQQAQQQAAQVQQGQRDAVAAQREAARQAKEQERIAEEERQRQVRIGEAQGRATATDINTGKKTLDVRPDGSPKFEVGPVGKPQLATIEQAGPAAPAAPGAPPEAVLGNSTMKQTVPVQTYRNEAGDMVTKPVATKTDAKTGVVTAETKDQFGAPQEVTTGVDAALQAKLKKDAELEAQRQVIELRQNNIAQYRLGFEPKWKDAKGAFDKAGSELNAFDASPKFMRDPATNAWVKRDPNTDLPMVEEDPNQFEHGPDGKIRKKVIQTPYDPNELVKWQRDRAYLQTEHDRAKAAHDKLFPQAEQLNAAEFAVKDAHLKLIEEKIRHDAGLPPIDGGAAETLANAEAGTKSPDQQALEDVVNPKYPMVYAPEVLDSQEAKDKQDGNTVNPPAVPNPSAPDSSVTPPSKPATIPLVPIADPSVTAVFAKAFSGLVAPEKLRVGDSGSGYTMIQRNGDNIGSIEQDSSGNRMVILNDNFTDSQDLRHSIAFGTTTGVPVYLRATDARPDTVKEAKYVASVFEALKDPILASDKKMGAARLAMLGADSDSIARKVKDGELSVQNGESIMKEVYGTTLKADDPLDGKTFGAWISGTDKDTKDAWTVAVGSKDTAAMNAVKNNYVSEWFVANRNKPGVTFKMREVAAAALTNKLRGTETVASVGGILVQAGGSMVGMLSAPVMGNYLAGATALGVDGAGDALDATLSNYGRASKNTWRGWEFSREKWFTGDGKAKFSAFESAQGDLRAIIQVQDSYKGGLSDPEFRKDYKAGIDKVTDAAFALQSMNREDGWEIKREDLDPSSNPALAKLVNGYALTGDKSLLDGYFQALMEDHGTRQAQGYLADLTLGRGTFMSALIAGANAPPEEIGTEIASDLLTAGMSKLMFGGAKVMKLLETGEEAAKAAGAASRMTRFRLSMLGGKESFMKAGMVTDTLAQPAGKIGKVSNTVVKSLKVQGLSTITEAGEEAAMSPADRNASMQGIVSDAAVGGLMGFFMGPIMAGPVALREASITNYQQTQAATKFAESYNLAGKHTPGFTPVTVDQARTAMALVPDEQRAKLLEGSRSAAANLIKAIEVSNSDMGKASVSGVVANNLARAQEASLRWQDALATDASMRTEAVVAIQNMAPEHKDFASALAKVASGRADLLTSAERTAAAGRQTLDGKPYFTTVKKYAEGEHGPIPTMVEVVTDAGHAEALKDFPQVAALIATPESVAIFDAAEAARAASNPTQTTQPDVTNPQGQPDVQGQTPSQVPVPTVPVGPSGSVDAGEAGGGAVGAGASQAQAETPVAGTRSTHRPPEMMEVTLALSNDPQLNIPAVVSRAYAKGRPVHVSMARAAGIKPPEGYVQQGHTLVQTKQPLQPKAKTPTVKPDLTVAPAVKESLTAQPEASEPTSSAHEPLSPENPPGKETNVGAAPDAVHAADATPSADTPQSPQTPQTDAHTTEESSAIRKEAQPVRQSPAESGGEADGQSHAEDEKGLLTPDKAAGDVKAPAADGLHIEPAENGTANVMHGDTMLANVPAADAEAKLAGYRDALHSPSRLAGLAITEAKEKFPALKDRALFLELSSVTDDLNDLMAELPPEDRKPFIDQAIGDWIDVKQIAQQQAEAERLSAKNSASAERAKQAKELRMEALRDKAREVLNSGVHEALSAIFQKGKITPKPNAIGLILNRRKQGAKLTEKEMGILRNLSDYDGAPLRSHYPGGGNNPLITQILNLIYARQGDGQMPNVMADGLIPNVTTASEMWEKVGQELRSLSNGKSMADSLDDPNHVWTEEEITAELAKNAPQMPVTIHDARWEASEAFGEHSELVKKIDAVEALKNRFTEERWPHVLAAIYAEIGRTQKEVVSAAEWQKMTEAYSQPSAIFQKFLDTHTPAALTAKLEAWPVVGGDHVNEDEAPYGKFKEPTRIVDVAFPADFPKIEDGVKAMRKWAMANVRGSWPAPALSGEVEVTTYGIGHTAVQTARNPERMRVIAALPELIHKARIVTPRNGENIQMHALARVDGKLIVARITVEERTGDSRGPWNRFYDIKGIETENVPDAYSAFPSMTEGSLLANPGREVTMDQLSQIVNGAANRIEDGQNDYGVKRSKPKSMIVFQKPFRGPSGASLVAYEWKHKLEEGVDRRGEDKVTRVSNWEEAQTNRQTGREIVHHFHVEMPDGKGYVVSLESALKMLGYTLANGKEAGPVRNLASMLRTRAKLAMEADALRPKVEDQESQVERYNRERSAIERERMPAPVFTVENGRPIMRIGPLEKWGMIAGTPESFAKRSAYDLRSLENEWRMEEARKRSGGDGRGNAVGELNDLESRIAKMDRKIQAQAATGENAAVTTEATTPTTGDLFASLADTPGPLAKFKANAQRAFNAHPEGHPARETIARDVLTREGVKKPGGFIGQAQRALDFGVSGSMGTKDQPGFNLMEPQSKFQRSFDFGTSGSFSQRNQTGFDFGGKATGKESLTVGDPLKNGTNGMGGNDVATANEVVTQPASPEPGTAEFKALPQEQKREAVKAISERKKAQRAGEVQDFGEKINTRKDQQSAPAKEISDGDLASMPFAKIWPKSEVDSIADTELASIAHALRDEIPIKPRKEWKVSGWVEKVKQVKTLMNYAQANGPDALMSRIALQPSLKDLVNKITLLGQIPREHWSRVGDVRDYPDAYRHGDNKEHIPAPYAYAKVDDKTVRGTSLEDVTGKVQELIGTGKAAPAMKFEVRSDRSQYYINKKGDPLTRELATFATSKEAFAHIRDNHNALVSAWEAVKDSDNVKESDVRGKENLPRVGKDHRNGVDATDVMFTNTFGFRGVVFGKWVEQGGSVKDRQGMLNLAFDSLMDLSDILGIPPKAISLDGSLGLLFGADGSGSASAHYSSTKVAINLTKTRGAGVLAHEWFHALDNYFQLKRPGKSLVAHGGNFITYQPETYYQDRKTGFKLSATRFDDINNGGGKFTNIDDWQRIEGVRPQVEERFVELVKALDASPMAKRASLIDKGKSGGYWSRIIERAARAFENYTIFKMQQQGYKNDYLANVVKPEDFIRDKGRYPYLLDEEMAPVVEAFDNLFATIEAKPTERGMALESPVVPFTHTTASLFASLLDTSDPKAQPRISDADKKKQVTDFANSIVAGNGGAAGKGIPADGLDAGRNSLQVLRQKLAHDLTVDPQVRFLGETIQGTQDLVIKAQALRNPRFETFYLFALRPNSGGFEVADVMAVSSRVPFSSAVFTDGKGTEEGLQDHANFLRNSGASHYVMLHNHPSGDPSPSKQDFSVTKTVIAGIRQYLPAVEFGGHLVINHKTYVHIDANGGHQELDVPGVTGQDPLGFPAKSMELGKLVDTPEKIIAAANQIEESKANPDLILGFFLNPRLGVVATVQGTADDFLSLTREQLQQYGASQGAVRLMLHGRAENRSAAQELVSRFTDMNEAGLVSEMAVDHGIHYFSAHEEGLFRMPAIFFGDSNSVGERVQEPEQPDLFAATHAPDATQKLGGVKVGTMSALGAYRTLTAKRDKLGHLSAEEEQKLLSAEQALGQKLAFDMESVKGSPVSQPIGQPAKSGGVAAPGTRSTQQGMTFPGEVSRNGQMNLLEPETPYGEAFRKEKAAILKTAPRGEDGHPLAPNGKRSNLTENQWATVRTGNFKRWFGDWQAIARQEHVRNIITRALDEKTWQERIIAAQGLDADPSGKLSDTFGFPVVKQFITPDDIRKTEKRHGAGNEKQADQLGLTRDDFVKMMEVLRDPETFRKTRSSNGKPSAEFGREFSDGTLIVAEVEVSEPGAVSIKSVWKKQPGRNHAGASSYPVRTSGNTAGLPTTMHSDSLIVNPESVSKVVDENGEPRVVFHGTNVKFDQFNPEMVGKVFGYDTEGFFFSSLASDAMDYAKNAARLHGGDPRVIPAFLNLPNPYSYADHAFEYGDADTAEKGMDGRLLIDWADMYRRDHLRTAKETGKDGIVIERGNEGLYTVFKTNQIKSATDNNGGFSDDPSMVKDEETPYGASQDAAKQALAKMPPMYRDVFEAVSGGATVPEVTAKFGVNERAVSNIINAVRSRMTVATAAAGPDGLKPVMRGDKFLGGRPDLALGANPTVAAVDQIRNESGVPDVRGWDEVNAKAAAMLERDYAGTYDAMLAKARNMEQMTDVEVSASKAIIAREMLEGNSQSPADRVKLAMMIHGYRDIGTETARALAIRRDPKMSPAERNAQFIAEQLFTPDEAVRARLRKAKPGDAEKILTGWMSRVDTIKAELLAQGIDIDASLKEYREKEAARKEAESEVPRTKAAIDETVRKLSKQEKTIVEALKTGSTYESAAFMSGFSIADVKDVYKQFYADIRAAMKESAKRYATESLREPERAYGANAMKSAPVDTLGDILAELGFASPDMIPENDADRARVKTELTRRERKPRAVVKKPTKPTLVTPTPEAQAALDSSWERFQEGDFTDRQSFQKEIGLYPINETTGDWNETRPFTGQGELAREPINETTGTFNINDPFVMREIAQALGRARADIGDKLMEFWRASVLSGPQTHIVNTTSNVLFSGFNLVPRRLVEAGINDLLGLVGQGSDKAATFREFGPMARNLNKALHLAARMAMFTLKSGGGKVFEKYAGVIDEQLDFDGMGAEYFPPALKGKLKTIMHSISFTPMTAADEFMKALYWQLDTAAQAHRIAAVEEKLTGAAYEARLNGLMEPGSAAALRALDESKRVTYQEKLDGKNPQAIRRLDQVVQGVKHFRAMPYIGMPLTFILPFIDTPTNIAKQAFELTPINGFLIVTDMIRSLRRRVYAGKVTPEEARAEAEKIYDRARLVRDLTNQAIAWAAFAVLAGWAVSDDDDKDGSGLPRITGTMPYTATKRGERDNAYAVMPAQTIRIGHTQVSYKRFDPLATVLATGADLALSLHRQNGVNLASLGETAARFKDQAKDKTFLQGLATLSNAMDNPERFSQTLIGGIITCFVPNLIRQPMREADTLVRDSHGSAADGFFTSLAKTMGYSVVPQFAPAKLDVWGNEIPTNRGAQVGGTRATDLAFRIFDPSNAQINPHADPIDLWIFRYNHQAADAAERVSIMPIADTITVRPLGSDTSVKVPLTLQERENANREAGKIARELLGNGWENRPMTEEYAKLIMKVVQKAQGVQRESLRMKKLVEMQNKN